MAECAACTLLERVLASARLAYEADDEAGNPDLKIVGLVARIVVAETTAVLKITVKRQLDRDPRFVLYNIVEVTG